MFVLIHGLRNLSGKILIIKMIVTGGTLEPGGMEVLVGLPIISTNVAFDTVFVRNNPRNIGHGRVGVAEKMFP